MSNELNKVMFWGNSLPNYVSNTSPSQSIRPDFRESEQNLDKYTTQDAITKLYRANPKISKILAQNSIPLILNMDGLNRVMAEHARTTRQTVLGISKNLPFNMYALSNNKALADAAYLHDLGKVFIPKEILDKNGKLNPLEQKIMHTHSELGYELLKTTDLDEKTLNLIRNHHQNPLKTGYPNVNQNFFADLNLQILSLADKYSALTERRAYKAPMTREAALAILYDDVKNGITNPIVYNSLVKYTAPPTSEHYLKGGYLPNVIDNRKA